tara:strand:+ start:151 stop:1419 length:1269 start_codon:yes stop_codon:yes gene_type:complete
MDNIKIAVLGSGISGLSCSWLLSKKHDVYLYEKNNYFGGHADTETIIDKDYSKIQVDTGFIVLNEINYKNLINLFKALNVETYASNMSFSVSKNYGELEYSGSGLQGLFSQKKNLLSKAFIKMLYEIIKFYLTVENDKDEFKNMTLSEYLEVKNYSEYFKLNHIYPMAGSIWSSSFNQISKYPFPEFVSFFSNHGLLKLFNRPKWHTVLGGSKSYVNKIINSKKIKAFTNTKVKVIDRTYNSKIVLEINKKKEIFDKLVIATHSDEAIKLLKDISANEKNALEKIEFTNNIVYLHKDKNLMPKLKKNWSSWNFVSDKKNNERINVTYWMNKLQNLGTSEDYFVSLNPIFKPKRDKILKKKKYSHPLFTKETFEAQKQILNLQGKKNTWFCGAYLGYGFHEDGIKSGLKVAENISGLKRPWDE